MKNGTEIPRGDNSNPDKKFLLVFMFSSKFYFSWSEIYVVRVEIVISIGMSFCKITLIVQNLLSISAFTVKRCTLRSIDFLFLITSVWNLLFLLFLYFHTLNNSIYIWLCAFKATSEFSWETPSLLLSNRLSFFCLFRPPPDGWSKQIYMVNSELFSQMFIFFIVRI